MTNDNVASKTVEIALEEVRLAIARQDAQTATLDSKANFGLGSATLLTAILGFHQASAHSARAPFWVVATIVCTIIGFGVYGYVVWSSYQAYKLRTFEAVPDPRELEDTYLNVEPDDIRLALIKARSKAFTHNYDLLTDKAKWTNKALKALGCEALTLGLISLIQIGTQ